MEALEGYEGSAVDVNISYTCN